MLSTLVTENVNYSSINAICDAGSFYFVFFNDKKKRSKNEIIPVPQIT